MTLRFDLGESRDLAELLLWNSLWTDTRRSVKEFDLHFFDADNELVGTRLNLVARIGKANRVESQTFHFDTVL